MDTLDPKRSVLEEIEADAPTSSIPMLRSLLGAFLFQGDDIYKSVSVLSGGERSRLSLVKLLLYPVNVLILDEPTNHLDIASKDMFLRALRTFKGTLIFVSHDIDFIKQLATKILYLSEDAVELFVGDYDYFSWKLDQKQHIDQDNANSEKTVQEVVFHRKAVDRQKRNKLRNRLQTLRREEANIMEELERLEQEVSDLHNQMNFPEVYSDGEKALIVKNQIDTYKEMISQKTHAWDKITHEAEILEKSYEG